MAKVIEDYDRAAPKGVGAAKVAGNYAAGMIMSQEQHLCTTNPPSHLISRFHTLCSYLIDLALYFPENEWIILITYIIFLDILPNMQSRTEGYPISLYLDALTGSFVEEFSTSNFLGIKLPDKSGRQIYVTPSSGAILKSITNMR